MVDEHYGIQVDFRIPNLWSTFTSTAEPQPGEETKDSTVAQRKLTSYAFFGVAFTWRQTSGP